VETAAFARYSLVPLPEAPPMTHRLSASRRLLAKWCLYWARGDVELPPQEQTVAARLGSATHEGAAEEGEGLEWALRPSVDLEVIAARWELTESQVEALKRLHQSWLLWWADFSQGRDWQTEVPFAFDTATGAARALPRKTLVETGHPEGLLEERPITREERAAMLTPTEVPGTTDALWISADGRNAIVIDLKTGRPPKRARDYLEQLLHTAVCVRIVHGVAHVRVVIAHVTADDVVPDWIDLDAFDLDVAAAEMRGDLVGLEQAVPRGGRHCEQLYCPLRAVCPRTTAALAPVLPAPLRAVPLTGKLVRHEDAAALLESLPLFEAWIEERRARVRELADETGGVQLPGGLVYGPIDKSRETLRLDVNGAEAALRKVLGDQADAAILRKTSKEAVRKAAAALATKRGDLTRICREVEDAMRAAGAMKVSRFKSYEVREAPKGDDHA